MGVFYCDILVDFLVAVYKAGNYTIEDVMVMNEVAGKSPLLSLFMCRVVWVD